MLSAEDKAHLKTLSICWYVYAGLNVLGMLCGGLYAVLGVVALFAGQAENDDEAVVMGIVFSVTGVIVMVLTVLSAVLFFLTAKGLANHKRKTLIYICSALACLNVPLGTVLGIFTFIVLGRPQVKAAFEAPAEWDRPQPY